MEVRRATVSDMALMVDYISEYHKDSNLSDIPLERRTLVKVLEHYIGAKDCTALIAVDGDKMHGILVGGLEPFFFNSKRAYATDVMFMSKGGGPQLWRKFKEWAFAMGADRMIMGVSSGDPRACQLLEALGMESTGGMYVLRG